MNRLSYLFKNGNYFVCSNNNVYYYCEDANNLLGDKSGILGNMDGGRLNPKNINLDTLENYKNRYFDIIKVYDPNRSLIWDKKNSKRVKL